jgi:hypothetical protein
LLREKKTVLISQENFNLKQVSEAEGKLIITSASIKII